MPSLVSLVGAAICAAAVATASFESNLNYNSPSPRHVRLGIDIPLVYRRAWKRANNAYDPSELSFTHGVSSGDPWDNSVILWTRIAPTNESDQSNAPVEGTAPLYGHETETYIQADANPICVEWKVFEERKGCPSDRVVSRGKAYTTSDIDFTVKV
jgi:alkaline phosphatase D